MKRKLSQNFRRIPTSVVNIKLRAPFFPNLSGSSEHVVQSGVHKSS
jgi:hypothetical protein